jgi:hypothetical protein
MGNTSFFSSTGSIFASLVFPKDVSRNLNVTLYFIQACLGSWLRTEEGLKPLAGIFSAVRTASKFFLSGALPNKAVLAS